MSEADKPHTDMPETVRVGDGGGDGDPGWRRILFVMWFAQTIAIIGFSFVLPFVPFYIRELGVTDDRSVALWAGALGSAMGVTMAVFAPMWGKVADRYGRRPMVLRAMLGGAVVLGLMGLAGSVYHLLILRTLQGMVTGTIAASQAMVSSAVPRRHLGFSMGLMQTAVFLGASIGPWIGGVAADHLGYRMPFFITGGLLLTAGLLVLVATRERFSRGDVEHRPGGRLRDVARLPGMGVMLGIFLAVNLANTIVAPIFPLFVEQLMADSSRAASLTGLIMGVGGLMAALSAVVIGRLGDRLGHKRALVLSTLLAGLMVLPHAAATSVAQLFSLRALFGLAVGGTGPSITALVGNLVPRSGYGRAYGLTHAFSSLGAGVGPVLGGLTAATMGLRMPFVLTGAVLLLLSLVASRRVPTPAPEPASAKVSTGAGSARCCGSGRPAS